MIFGGIQDIFQANILSTRGFCIYWLSCPIILKKSVLGLGYGTLHVWCLGIPQAAKRNIYICIYKCRHKGWIDR